MLAPVFSSEPFTPKPSLCQLYETATNDCADDALRYLSDTGDVVDDFVERHERMH